MSNQFAKNQPQCLKLRMENSPIKIDTDVILCASFYMRMGLWNFMGFRGPQFCMGFLTRPTFGVVFYHPNFCLWGSMIFFSWYWRDSVGFTKCFLRSASFWLALLGTFLRSVGDSGSQVAQLDCFFSWFSPMLQGLKGPRWFFVVLLCALGSRENTEHWGCYEDAQQPTFERTLSLEVGGTLYFCVTHPGL